MTYEIKKEKALELTFKESFEIDNSLLECIIQNQTNMLPCTRSFENDKRLFFDMIGTNSLKNYLEDNTFSSDELHGILLELTSTLVVLMEHGFSEKTILLDPEYVFISSFDGRPRFVCLPIKINKHETNCESSKVAALFNKIALSVHSNNA